MKRFLKFPLTPMAILLFTGTVLLSSCDLLEEDTDVDTYTSDTSPCPGPEALRYKDLMDNNPLDDCQQIWAQQAVWYAYKCECDNGLGSASDAQNMVAVLNSIRDNIINLYATNGGSSNTACGSIPPKVSSCGVK